MTKIDKILLTVLIINLLWALVMLYSLSVDHKLEERWQDMQVESWEGL